jgi:hypothetical protein
MAVWHNNKRYPAQITKVLEPGKKFYTLHKILSIQDFCHFLFQGNFEVIFYDGFSMQVKAKQMSRMPKEQADKMVFNFTIFKNNNVIK